MDASHKYANKESVNNRYMKEATGKWSAAYWMACQ